MLHNTPPPIAELQRWLRGVANVNGGYGHLLFEQATAPDEQLAAALRTYSESAHADAREVFHAAARIDLHPDADAPGAHAQYPSCLPPTAQKGLFGEVMAGLFVEAFQFVGNHRWSIPIFDSRPGFSPAACPTSSWGTGPCAVAVPAVASSTRASEATVLRSCNLLFPRQP